MYKVFSLANLPDHSFLQVPSTELKRRKVFSSPPIPSFLTLLLQFSLCFILFFFLIFETRSHCFAQANLELLGSSDPPISDSELLGHRYAPLCSAVCTFICFLSALASISPFYCITLKNKL
jgi:hypothetical protein